MQIREFSKPVTAQALNEGLAKKFGYKINFEQFSDVQLEDARNKLRTKVSQFEMNESYDSVLENHDYQKTRMFLDCINQEILEREERIQESEEEDDEDSKEDSKEDKKDEEKKDRQDESYNFTTSTIRSRAKQYSIPQSWINSAIQRIELGESDKAELKAELQVRYDLNESTASWLLLEGEESKAEIIMATKDMVDRITGWLEDVAAMKAEQLLELQDSIRDEIGSDVAQSYVEAVKPALEAIYTALETSRQGLSGALSIVSGGEAPTMGAPVGGMGNELGGPDLGAPATGAAPVMGAEESPLSTAGTDLGREKRESVDYSRRLGILLNSKKK
jgi:hypothetical protein